MDLTQSDRFRLSALEAMIAAILAKAYPSPAGMEEFATVLRLLCKSVAQHTQRELEFALREEPNLPL